MTNISTESQKYSTNNELFELCEEIKFNEVHEREKPHSLEILDTRKLDLRYEKYYSKEKRGRGIRRSHVNLLFEKLKEIDLVD